MPSLVKMLALCVLPGGVAHAQSPVSGTGPAYPVKPLRMIVAFPPGGGTDIAARVVGQKMAEGLGQAVVIDNRAGAAGIIGTELAVRTSPDGYSLFMGTMGNLAVNPSLYPKLTFDVQRDLAMVSQVVSVLFVLYAHPAFPAQSVKALIALARAQPGQIQYGNGGVGGAPHLAGALFESMAKVKLVSVPYKGGGPSFTELIGGHIPIAFESGLQGIGSVRAGKVRALAVLSARASPLLPGVSPMAETLPGYELVNWFALATPAATPRDIVSRLHTEVARALKAPEVRDKLLAQGAEPVGSTPEHMTAFLQSETAKWSRVIRDAGIRVP